VVVAATTLVVLALPLPAAAERVLIPGPVIAPLHTAKTQLAPFDNSPFPYRGEWPGQGKPFLDVVDGEKRGHTSPRGGVYWEHLTYSDRRALLHLPRGFDSRRPALMVVYFHGNQARLERDVRDRQQVPRQLAQSGLNAALVAPQFAVNALDSSAGRFWEKDVFARFVAEAADRLARLHGDARAAKTFAAMPVVLVAYSGGYHPAAFALNVGGANARVRGVILLDAPYGEEDFFSTWLAANRAAFLVSAYAKPARSYNMKLQSLLTDAGVRFQTTLPARIAPGTVAFFDSGDATVHNDFVTRAWVNDPLKVLLSRIAGFSRTGR
jgi:hypothetical protein